MLGNLFYPPILWEIRPMPLKLLVLLGALLGCAPFALAARRKFLLPIVALAAANVMSGYVQASPYSYSTFLVIPFVFWAQADGLSRLSEWRPGLRLAAVSAAGVIFAL